MTIPTQTALQSAQIKGAEAAHYLAATLKFSWELIFNRDPQLVIAELNADPSAIASMQLNATLAAALNPLLDGLNDDRFPARIPSSMPDGFSIIGGSFTYTAPSED